MQSLLEALHEKVIPALRRSGGRLAPCAEMLVPARETLREVCVGVYDYNSQAHSWPEFFWLLSGAAAIKIEERFYALQAGDACLISPGLRHADVWDEHTPPYQLLWMMGYNDRTSLLLFFYEPPGRWNMSALCTLKADPTVGAALVELEAELQHENPYTGAMQQGLVLQLAASLARNLDHAEQDPDAHRLLIRVGESVRCYLEEHYARPLTLDEVAQAVHLSPGYMGALFKQETGKTVVEALTEIRLRHARCLRLEKRGSVTQIARACGFGSVEHFSRVFRRATNVPPSRYGKPGE